jgi:hypothetical protein
MRFTIAGLARDFIGGKPFVNNGHTSFPEDFALVPF